MIYARHHFTAEDREQTDIRTARQPQAWDEITHTDADIKAARSEVAEIEASLADVEEELGWAALTGDGPGCDVLAPMAEAAVRDLERARARLKEMEAP